VSEQELLASVVISTYNRADALGKTLAALGHQDIAAERYELIVVDDGSIDDTPGLLARADVPSALRTIRHETNKGVSAGRNAGMQAAVGRYLIMLSDDLIVSPNFIAEHVRTLNRFPGTWVVGGFRQLESLTATPFGRYLDALEARFTEERKSKPIAPGIWEMSWPTARNLSLPRADLERTGLFDERFRTTCEDQDLAERARAAGIRFIYNEAIDCLHNDAAADLERYCRFQEGGASDTALFVAVHGGPHLNSPIAHVNGRALASDTWQLRTQKALKSALARPRVMRFVHHAIRLSERLNPPDWFLARAYRSAISLAMFRGWRRGAQRWGLSEPPV